MFSRSWRATGVWLLCSLAVAAVGFGGPWLTHWGAYWHLSIWMGLGWILLTLAGLAVLRWRGLILLIGAPLALYYPIGAYFIIAACAKNLQMCP